VGSNSGALPVGFPRRLACPSMPTTCGTARLVRQELAVPELEAFHKRHSLRWPWWAGCGGHQSLRRETSCADALAPPRMRRNCAQRSLAKVPMACVGRNQCTAKRSGGIPTLSMLASVQDHARRRSLMLGLSARRELAPAAAAAAAAAAALEMADLEPRIPTITGPISRTTQLISLVRKKLPCPTPALEQQ